jgi:hypothetical protein
LIKCGGVSDPVRTVAALRDAMGQGMDIMIDLRVRPWMTPGDAARPARAPESWHLLYTEDPVAPHSPVGPLATVINLHFSAAQTNLRILEYRPPHGPGYVPGAGNYEVAAAAADRRNAAGACALHGVVTHADAAVQVVLVHPLQGMAVKPQPQVSCPVTRHAGEADSGVQMAPPNTQQTGCVQELGLLSIMHSSRAQTLSPDSSGLTVRVKPFDDNAPTLGVRITHPTSGAQARVSICRG